MSLNPAVCKLHVFINVLMVCLYNILATGIYASLASISSDSNQTPFIEAEGFQSWFTSSEWIEGLAWDGFIPTKKVMTTCPGWRDLYKWSPSFIFRFVFFLMLLLTGIIKYIQFLFYICKLLINNL